MRNTMKNDLFKNLISKPLGLHLLVVVTTVLITRVALWISWDQSYMEGMKEDSWHHAYTGVLMLIAVMLIFRKNLKAKVIFSGIAVGLIFDELTTFLCLFNYHIDYWSRTSVITASIALVLYSCLTWRKIKTYTTSNM
jgi:hypothetical protein